MRRKLDLVRTGRGILIARTLKRHLHKIAAEEGDVQRALRILQTDRAIVPLRYAFHRSERPIPFCPLLDMVVRMNRFTV
ncbi:hypothetical protein D3C84_984190 [compost metagenome]